MSGKKYVIGKNTPDGVEYICDPIGDVVYFDSKLDAMASGYVAEASTDELSNMFLMGSKGTCVRCGAPLFESKLPGYEYQCFECDEDFYAFEQSRERVVFVMERGMPIEAYATTREIAVEVIDTTAETSDEYEAAEKALQKLRKDIESGNLLSVWPD